MNLLGPDPLDAAVLTRDLPRAAALFQGAPPGYIAIATRSDAAFARAALGAWLAGRALRPLDPAHRSPDLRGVGLLLREQGGAAWPETPAVRDIAPPARPTARQRLFGLTPPPDPTFPGCLVATDVAPAPPEDGPALLVDGLAPIGRVELDARAGALAEQLGPDARPLLLLPWSQPDAVSFLHAVHRLDATLLRVGPDAGAADVVDAAWRERATHVVGTPGQLGELARGGEDLEEVFGAPSFRAFVSVGGGSGLLAGRDVIGAPSWGAPAPVIDAGADTLGRVIAVAARTLRESAARLSAATRAGETAGWTSLGHLDLVVAIEAEFGIRVSGAELARVRCLGDFVRLVEARG